ncbi:hypothetical protein BDN72DRAFT_882372 [Pluteus cervinus]|uniref:Uncharacterized protein n=1 Tax=Pluteus cervinus TaxID=181527 RepID=A0ACD3AB36_9AGAR|nr:hypothetical protein BDN72DRAFT_882372 [Pluteus cervinus]
MLFGGFQRVYQERFRLIGKVEFKKPYIRLRADLMWIPRYQRLRAEVNSLDSKSICYRHACCVRITRAQEGLHNPRQYKSLPLMDTFRSNYGRPRGRSSKLNCYPIVQWGKRYFANREHRALGAQEVLISSHEADFPAATPEAKFPQIGDSFPIKTFSVQDDGDDGNTDSHITIGSTFCTMGLANYLTIGRKWCGRVLYLSFEYVQRKGSPLSHQTFEMYTYQGFSTDLDCSGSSCERPMKHLQYNSPRGIASARLKRIFSYNVQDNEVVKPKIKQQKDLDWFKFGSSSSSIALKRLRESVAWHGTLFVLPKFKGSAKSPYGFYQLHRPYGMEADHKTDERMDLTYTW